jgi:DNA-binding PadR family transcriptional regulator
MLRHITLDIIQRKPMSGSELMEEIEYYTDWRPSPGSVYPLLSKLDEQGLIESVESEDPSLKRYVLTSSGIEAVEEHRRLEPHIRSRYHSIQKIYWKLFRGMNGDLFETYLRLSKALEKAHPLLEKDPETASRIQDLLRETAEKIEEIDRQSKRPV